MKSGDVNRNQQNLEHRFWQKTAAVCHVCVCAQKNSVCILLAVAMFQLDIRIAMTGMSVFIGSAQRIATSVVLVLQHHRHKQHCCTKLCLTIPIMIQIMKIMILIIIIITTTTTTTTTIIMIMIKAFRLMMS